MELIVQVVALNDTAVTIWFSSTTAIDSLEFYTVCSGKKGKEVGCVVLCCFVWFRFVSFGFPPLLLRSSQPAPALLATLNPPHRQPTLEL